MKILSHFTTQFASHFAAPLLLLLAGCASPQIRSAERSFPFARIQPFHAERFAPDNRSFQAHSRFWESLRMVIRDPEAWEVFCAKLALEGSMPRDLPSVDFETEMVVVAALGRRPYSGDKIFVPAAYIHSDLIEVLVDSVFPTGLFGRAGPQPSPVDIARLPRSELPIIFTDLERQAPPRSLIHPPPVDTIEAARPLEVFVPADIGSVSIETIEDLLEIEASIETLLEQFPVPEQSLASAFRESIQASVDFSVETVVVLRDSLSTTIEECYWDDSYLISGTLMLRKNERYRPGTPKTFPVYHVFAVAKANVQTVEVWKRIDGGTAPGPYQLFDRISLQSDRRNPRKGRSETKSKETALRPSLHRYHAPPI